MAASTVTFGEIMLRLTPPGFERLLQSPTMHATFGGGEANVAASLAGFGLPATFVTILPQANPLADAAIGELRRFGVDTSHIARSAGRMGIYFLETGASQTGIDGSSTTARAAPLLSRPPASTGRASWPAPDGFTSPGSRPRSARRRRTSRWRPRAQRAAWASPVSCDLNFRKNLWKWGKTASEVMPELVKLSDILIANEEDIQMALGVASDVDVHAGALDRASFCGLTEAVMRDYGHLRGIAVTLRESKSASHNVWSACLHDGREFLLSRTYDIAHIVDRVGAGDSFAAGLIYGMQSGLGSQECAGFCRRRQLPEAFDPRRYQSRQC